jgi:hypothetical protein
MTVPSSGAVLRGSAMFRCDPGGVKIGESLQLGWQSGSEPKSQAWT